MDQTTCSMCSHAHKPDGSCDCGCGGMKMACSMCGHMHKDDDGCDCGCK